MRTLQDIPASNFEMKGPAIQFDYVNQAWVRDGKYVRCGHLESMDCRCFGKLHEGETADQSLIE